MSKFDKYFNFRCSKTESHVDFILQLKLKLYDKYSNEWLLEVVRIFNDQTRMYFLSQDDFTWTCSNEDELLFEEDLFYRKTNVGKCLYV